MESHLPAASRIASIVALLIACGCACAAHAQSMNFEKYCKERYGDQSRAVPPGEKDANSWRCSKGSEAVAVDVADLCARQYGSDRVPVEGNRSAAWTCVARDNALTGTVSPERVNADIERDAQKIKDEGKSSTFCRKFYFFFPANATEFAAVAKNTLFLISVWTHKPEELPLKGVYVRANGQDLPAIKVSGARSEQSADRVSSQVCGAHREDGIYLIPTGAMLREGLILMDFSATRTGYNMLRLPSRVALDQAEKDAMYKSPDPPPDARVDLKALQTFVRRKLPGFPVPTALP